MPPPARWSWRTGLQPCYWIVALGLLLRLVVVVVRHDQLTIDTDAYLAIAKCLLSGDGFCSVPGHPTAYRPPLYPWLIAFCMGTIGPIGIGLMQIACGGLTVWLTYKLARQLDLTESAAVVAASIVAVDPLLLNYTSQAMTEVVMTLLTTAYLCVMSVPNRSLRHGFSAGFLYGLNALCRPTIWAFGLAMLAIATCGSIRIHILKRVSNERPSVTWRWSLAFIVALIAVVSPWAVRNALVFGQPILTTTHGGYTLVLGNNDAYFTDVISQPRGAVWSGAALARWQAELEQELNQQSIARTDELRRDAAMTNIGLNWIQHHPTSFLTAALHRMRLLWSPMPQAETGLSHWVVCLIGLWYSGVLLAAIVGIFECQRRSSAFTGLLILIASLTALHSVYWANARMRAPATAAIAIFAAVNVQRSICRFKSA